MAREVTSTWKDGYRTEARAGDVALLDVALLDVPPHFDQRGPVSSMRHTGPFTNIAPSNFTKPGAAAVEIQ